MSAEYKVTKGIYTRKYQAKNIWEVGGAYVEKQRKIRTTHGLCECCASVVWVSHKLRTTKVLCEFHTRFAQLKVLCEFRTRFAQPEGVVRISHKPGAVVFRRPYLPHFSSKSYTVWSVRFLTSWALKWYIVCKKWTWVITPKVQRKTTAAVLYFLHFACFSSLLLSFTWLVLMIQKVSKH